MIVSVAYKPRKNLIIMRYIQVFLFYTIVMPMVSAFVSTLGHFFKKQELPNSNLIKQGMAGRIQPSFTLCSLQEECRYVRKGIRKGRFDTRGRESNLQNDKRYLHMWKKITPGKPNLH